jgi:hypothetical protein
MKEITRFDLDMDGSMEPSEHGPWVLYKDIAQQKRPQNCGTGYCSCIECVVEPVACDGWLQEGSLLYRLTDGRKPQNRDEINVTMADESRSVESRTRRAGELLDRIRATPPIVATPLAAQKPWEGLTDAQILAANYPDGEENEATIAAPDVELIGFARAIEAKLKEKNT